MTDFIAVNHYKATLGSPATNLKFDSNIQRAIDAVSPYKQQLTTEQYRHFVLYVLLQLTGQAHT